MSPLISIKENSTHSNNNAIKAADFLLTPARNTFGGKSVEVIVAENNRYSVNTTDEASYGLKRLAWAVIVVVTLPLSAIAALVKVFERSSALPQYLGTADHPLTSLQEAKETTDKFRAAGIHGRIDVFVKTPGNETEEKAKTETSATEDFNVLNIAAFEGVEKAKTVASAMENFVLSNIGTIKTNVLKAGVFI